MKQSPLIILCLCCLITQAQTLNFSISDTVIIFGDKVNLRKGPTAQAPVVRQLAIGDRVYVLDQGDKNNLHTVNGLSLPWVHIKTEQGQTGYVWAGALSAMPAIVSEGTMFVAQSVQAQQSPNEFADKVRIVFELRAVRNGQIISTDTMRLDVDPHSDIYFRNAHEGALGLPGEKMLLHFHIGYPACGYNIYNLYFLWNGRQFSKLPPLIDMSDSGIVGYHEDYIFPEDPADTQLHDLAFHLDRANNIYLYVTVMETEVFEDGSGLNGITKTVCRRLVKTKSGWQKPPIPDFKTIGH